MMNKINEFIYFITGKPYFVVYVTKNNRKVKRFIQLAADKEKGSDIFLVSKELKSAWWKPEYPIIDGLKFITFVDLNNAIPLIISKEVSYDTTPWFIKETTSTKIEEDKEKQKQELKDGKSLNLVEIHFPPTLLHQMVEAHFVKEILSIPPNKNEWMQPVFIVGILALLIFGYIFLNKGGGLMPI